MHQMLLDHVRVFSVLAEFNIYPEQPSSHLPWFVKLSLIGFGIRAIIWLYQQFSKEKTSPQLSVSRPMAKRSAPRQAAPPPLEPAAARDVLILKGDQQLGPYGLEEIRQRMMDGTFELSDLAWHEGLDEWQPLRAIPGVMASGPLQTPSKSASPGRSAESSALIEDIPSASASGVLIGGYLCAALSLLFLPPVLGLAGIICGVVVIKRQRVNQGVALLVVSFACAAVGMMIGAATA